MSPVGFAPLPSATLDPALDTFHENKALSIFVTALLSAAFLSCGAFLTLTPLSSRLFFPLGIAMLGASLLTITALVFCILKDPSLDHEITLLKNRLAQKLWERRVLSLELRIKEALKKPLSVEERENLNLLLETLHNLG